MTDDAWKSLAKRHNSESGECVCNSFPPPDVCEIHGRAAVNVAGMLRRLRRAGDTEVGGEPYWVRRACRESASMLKRQAGEIAWLENARRADLEVIKRLREALVDVRVAIMEQAPDTLWAGLIETAVDRIGTALSESEGK